MMNQPLLMTIECRPRHNMGSYLMDGLLMRPLSLFPLFHYTWRMYLRSNHDPLCGKSAFFFACLAITFPLLHEPQKKLLLPE